MGKINKFLLMVIAMVGIMIAAVGIDMGVKHYNDQKWEKERVARYEQAYADVADIQMKISQLAQDKEAIEAFIEENKEYFNDTAEFGDEFDGPAQGSLSEPSFVPENMAEASTGMNGPDAEDMPGADIAISGNVLDGPCDISGNAPGDSYGVSGNGAEGNHDVSGNEPGTGQDVSGNETEGNNSVSGNGMEGNQSVSGNEPQGSQSVSGNEPGSSQGVSDNELAGSSISGNGLEGNQTASGNEPGVSGTASGNGLTGSVSADGIENVYGVSGNGAQGIGTAAGNTLQEKRKIRGSYMETQMQNQVDLDVISNNSYDFSGVSITCLGDSITAGANLDNMENYQQHAYPARLKELLGAEQVTNLGIGGSSIGRYWENAFVDRFKEIPADTDLIVVMGGTNDGFCMSQDELGNMQERKARTFIGDLDELMRGLKENYPAAEIVFVTPLPNVLHDMLRKERNYLLPQNTLVNAIIQLATEYDIQVIDLYNSNILDTHDAAVIYNYMPDGVHCNTDGYSVLAEHLAAELIRIYGGVETQTGNLPQHKAQDLPKEEESVPQENPAQEQEDGPVREEETWEEQEIEEPGMGKEPEENG